MGPMRMLVMNPMLVGGGVVVLILIMVIMMMVMRRGGMHGSMPGKMGRMGSYSNASPAETQDAPDQRVCPSCGSAVQAGWKACPQCGQALV